MCVQNYIKEICIFLKSYKTIKGKIILTNKAQNNYKIVKKLKKVKKIKSNYLKKYANFIFYYKY